MTATLLVVGVGTAVVFVAVPFIEGVLRPGYDPIYHTVSELSRGDRGWVQIANFALLGLGMFAYAVAINQTLNSLLGAVLVAIFGLGAVVSGVFLPDPIRGYPPGSPAGIPSQLSRHHQIHNAAGPVMFFAIFGACIVLAGHLQGFWRLYTVLTAVAGIRPDHLDSSGMAERRKDHRTRTTRPHPRVPELDRPPRHPPRHKSTSSLSLQLDLLGSGCPP